MGSDQLMLALLMGQLLVGARGMIGYPSLYPPECSNQSYDQSSIVDPFVQAIIEDLLSRATGNFNYYNWDPPDKPVVWGHGACSSDDGDVCWRCLSRSAVDIRTGCAGRAGAQETLVNCRLRYEFYPFRDLT